MDPFNDPLAYARSWIDAWNRGDVEAVLALFADDCTFTSPKAQEVVGTATVHGKAALREYWLGAITRLGRPHFELDDVAADAVRGSLAIFYRSSAGGRQVDACERLRFGPGGRVEGGAGYYGARLG